MRWEQWVGVYLIAASGCVLLLFGLVAWGTRSERREQAERALPRCVVRFDDYLRSVGDCGGPTT